MKALLDELRVDEDGTLYIGIVPPEPCGQDGVNLTLALTKGTPCAERITAVLD